MEHQRPSPEQLLRQAEAEEQSARRGKLKVFLGYTSGVGKSFRMLDEGRRQKARGKDVIVAAVQPEAPHEVLELLKSFEIIPPMHGLDSPCIDVAAVKRRRPELCLIDGLAYTNPPGSKNHQRWQDVEELLASNISVTTTINLQYIREKQAQVERIRGKRVKDSVPESFLRRAAEIEIVDAPAEHCIVSSPENHPFAEEQTAQQAQQLSELREIALVLTADVVDQQLEEYLRGQGIEQTYGTQERILVCVTPRSNASLMISRGKRQAEYFHGELFAAYVDQGDLRPQDRETLERNLQTAREADAHVEILHGEDPVAAILKFAEQHGITQIFIGHSLRGGWLKSFRSNPVERLIMEADGIDVRIFPHDGANA